jgi:hypothetical protein
MSEEKNKTKLGKIGSISLIYVGIAIGNLVPLYCFDVKQYVEIMSPVAVIYGIINVSCFVQMSLLLVILGFLSRKGGSAVFSSVPMNLVFGLLFAFAYTSLSIYVLPKFPYIDNWWFNLVILPVLVFIPLASVYLILAKQRHQ